MNVQGWGTALVVSWVLVGCSGSTEVGKSIGPSGGTLEGEGARLVIPMGAVSQPVTFTLSAVANAPTPDGGVLAGKMVRVGPSGLQLTARARLTLEWSPQSAPDAGSANVVVYTAPSGGAASDFVPLQTTVVDGTHVSVEVDHFSDFAPILPRAVANTCNQTFCQQAGAECLYCEFPMCVPPGSICCGASFCTPEAGACRNCNGQPKCGEC